MQETRIGKHGVDKGNAEAVTRRFFHEPRFAATLSISVESTSDVLPCPRCSFAGLTNIIPGERSTVTPNIFRLNPIRHIGVAFKYLRDKRCA